MGLIKEPKNVDFSMRSEPWAEQELKDLSEYIKKSKAARLSREKRKNKTVIPAAGKTKSA